MKTLGKVLKIYPKEEGMSKSENYFCKQTIVVEEGDRKLAIEFFGEKKVKKLEEVSVGELVEVTFFIESRPYENDQQERWFTTLNGSSLTRFVKINKAEDDV